MMNKTFIYVLENNSIPVYVGKAKNPKTRFSYHKRTKIITGYFIIDEVPHNDWKFWEKHYISLFKSWNFVLLNKNNGGGGRENMSKSEKEKRSKKYKGRTSPMKGKKQSDYNKQKTREAHLGVNYHTPEGLEKISKIQKNRDRTEEAKKKWKQVNQYSLNGNFIKTWDSIKEAEIYYNISRGNVSACCRGAQKTAKGFIWKFT